MYGDMAKELSKEYAMIILKGIEKSLIDASREEERTNSIVKDFWLKDKDSFVVWFLTCLKLLSSAIEHLEK